MDEEFGLIESKTTQKDDALNEQLEYALHQPSSSFIFHEIAKIASEHDPIDLAHTVSRLPLDARVLVYENLPDVEAKVIFMIHTGRQTRAAVYAQLKDSEIQELLQNMAPDEAVSLLDDLSDRRMKRVLEGIDPVKAERIRALAQHDRHTAGRIMTNEFFAFPMEASIGRVAAAIRENPGIDLERRVFVLNDRGELTGFAPIRALIVNPAFLPIRQVMRPVLHQVQPDTHRDEVVELVERYKISTLPVVDDEGKLLGIIPDERIVEAMEDMADETIASMAGTAEDLSQPQPVWKRFLWRAPWLVVTLFAGLLTAGALSYFRESNWFAFVALFVPLIAGMSGNVGIQCSTVVVRAISNGEISLGNAREAVGEELRVGGTIALLFGSICGLVVYGLNRFLHQGESSIHPLGIGLVVGVGLFGACMIAACIGTLAPFVFARLRIDPAIASGPIVTACNDVLSTLMYIWIAKLVGQFFFVSL